MNANLANYVKELFINEKGWLHIMQNKRVPASRSRIEIGTLIDKLNLIGELKKHLKN